MLSYTIVHNREEWDQALVTLPAAHALQSWAWGDFKSRWGWTVERLLWVKAESAAVTAGQPVAAAQVLARPIPGTPWRFLYISQGPALDYSDISVVAQVLAGLEAYARKAGALFIKIDPDIPRYYGEPAAGQPPDLLGQTIFELLGRRGWRFSPEQIQFRNTVMIDLTGEPEQLLARMKSKWRYNIRLAERKGVEIRAGDQTDIPTFYQMYAATATRDGFLIRPEAYYRDVWPSFLASGRAEMWLASVKGQIVAGLILFIFGAKAWYMYGASTGRHRNLMPNHLLQWTAMCRARARGCTVYDMWGAPDIFDESDNLWGVYRFKRGFGGQVVQGLGAYDYPVQPGLYWAFTVLMPRIRSLLRRLRGQ